MAIIAIAVYDTVENNRSKMTLATLRSLAKTVDWNRHRLFISDNGSCDETLQIYVDMAHELPFTLLLNGENLGTAAAINKAWKHRNPGEAAVKMDNDVTIAQAGWADWMEDVFDRDPAIGICGLKRKDLGECPWGTGAMRSTLHMLRHQPGQRWLVVEKVHHVMGTVQGYSSKLLDEIGYLYQIQNEGNKYGFDDSLASVRAHLAGYSTVFLCGFEIEHIDPGGDAYCKEKKEIARKWMTRYQEVVKEYRSGKRPLYWSDK